MLTKINNINFPLISIIILNYNGQGILELCLKSVLNSDYPNFEVILVDNASTDGSIELVEKLFGTDHRLKVMRNIRNLFFTGGNNVGIKKAKGEYLVLLNNDTEVESNWLKEIVKVLKDKNVGAAQPKILLYDSHSQRIDNTGGMIDIYGYAQGRGHFELDTKQYDNEKEIFYAGGTAMVIRKKVLEEVGLLDSKFVAHAEDVDLSWRIRLRGYKILLVPKAVVYHKVSRTISKCNLEQELSWHMRKNRLSTLIKNYNFGNLIKIIPRVVFFYFLVFIKECVLDKNCRKAATSLSALLWNIKELPYLWRQRRIVQGEIRHIQDKEILRLMKRRSILREKYFKPYFVKHFKS